MKKSSTMKAIAIGVMMGAAVPFAAMLPTSKSADAAIAVYDAKNIEEAIKTAIQTASILDNNTKQLLLMILNTKSLDGNVLAQILQTYQRASKSPLAGDAKVDPEMLKRTGKVPSILNEHVTAAAVLDEMGTIEDVLNGNATLVDLYTHTVKNKKALDATYRASVETAQLTQTADKEAIQMVQQALETTKGEEVGQKQMMQAQIAIQAANALMTHNGNNLLANVLAQEAQDLYTQNYYNALADEEARRARESLRRSAGLSTSGSSTSNSNNSTSNNNNSSSLYDDLTKTAIEVASMSGKSASQQ